MTAPAFRRTGTDEARPSPSPPCRTDATASAHAQSARVALVIGEGGYQSAPALANPPNDARDIAQALRALGFEVSLQVDLDQAQMNQAIADFGGRAEHADLALFYYGGHGLQLAQHNYLVPVDAVLRAAADIGKHTVSLDAVIDAMAKGDGRRLVFLDACRENPLKQDDAEAAPGLARVGKAADFMIAFATQPDAVAFDGAGRNSPFAQALLAHLTTAGVDLSNMMIARQLRRAGGHRRRADAVGEFLAHPAGLSRRRGRGRRQPRSDAVAALRAGARRRPAVDLSATLPQRPARLGRAGADEERGQTDGETARPERRGRLVAACAQLARTGDGRALSRPLSCGRLRAGGRGAGCTARRVARRGEGPGRGVRPAGDASERRHRERAGRRSRDAEGQCDDGDRRLPTGVEGGPGLGALPGAARPRRVRRRALRRRRQALPRRRRGGRRARAGEPGPARRDGRSCAEGRRRRLRSL